MIGCRAKKGDASQTQSERANVVLRKNGAFVVGSRARGYRDAG